MWLSGRSTHRRPPLESMVANEDLRGLSWVYYLTHSDIGFRHPIDPVVAIFLVYGISPLVRQENNNYVKEGTTCDAIKESDQISHEVNSGGGAPASWNLSS